MDIKKTVKKLITDRMRARQGQTVNKKDVFLAAMIVRQTTIKIGENSDTCCAYLEKGGHGVIEINPKFFDDYFQGMPERIQWLILVHELYHLILLHPLRCKELTNTDNRSIAVDVVVNQLIPDLNNIDTLPGKNDFGHITFNNFCELFLPGVNIEQNRDVKYYYDLLEKETRSIPPDTGKRGQHIISDTDGITIDAEIFRKAVEKELSKVGLNASDIGIEPKPANKINWRKILRQFVATAKSNQTKVTRKRAHRAHGLLLPKKVREKQPDVTVLVDTSGSMSGHIDDIASELLSLSGRYNVRFDLYNIDTELYYIGKINTEKDLTSKQFSGGGGTDFTTGLIELESHGVKSLVFLTDTEGSYPDRKLKYSILQLTTQEPSSMVPSWLLNSTVNLETIFNPA